jgi:hypothetical protein
MIQEAVDALSKTELTNLRKLDAKAARNPGGTTVITAFQRAAMQKAYDAAKAAGKLEPRVIELAKELGLKA